MLDLGQMNDPDHRPSETDSSLEDLGPSLEEAARVKLRQRRAQVEAGETELVGWDDVRAQLMVKSPCN